MKKIESFFMLLVPGLLLFFWTPYPCIAGDFQPISTPALDITAVADGFKLTWDADANDEGVYKVYWSNDDGVSESNYSGILTTGGSAFEHTGLEPGQTYYYRLQACNCECGELSNQVSAVFEPQPVATHVLSGTLMINGAAIQPDLADRQLRATIRAEEVTRANQGNTIRVNSDGTYRMALFPGTYNITIDLWLEETWHGTEIYFGTWGTLGPQDLEIAADTSHSIDIPLQSLTGLVQDADGMPIAGADISYRNGSATTSAEPEYEGVFKLYFIPGNYRLEVIPPDGTRFGQAGMDVSVPGTDEPCIVLQTLPLLAGNLTVNGESIQTGLADGTISATVRADDVTGANPAARATVHPDGTYRMALLPGTYNITVDLWLGEDRNGTWTDFDAWGMPGPQHLTIEDTDKVQDIDILLHSLTGIVQDAGGTPIPGVEVSYLNGAATTSAEAGFEGSYTLYFIPGTYELAVKPPADTRYGPTTVNVSIPEQDRIPTIELQSLPLLSGMITINGNTFAAMPDRVFSASIKATEISGAAPGNSVAVQPDGSYRLALAPGTYQLSVDIRLKEAWQGTDIHFSHWGHPGPNLSIDADTVQDIEIPLNVLSGTVTTGDGSPVSGVELSYRNGAAESSAQEGAQGTYKLYFVPGTYDLQVTAPPALFPPFQINGLEIATDAERDIVLGQNDTPTPAAPNQPPVAAAGGPYDGTAGTPVVFDAGDTYDVDGAIVLYEWDFDDDGVFEESTPHPTIAHAWQASHEGTVRLRVTDDRGFVEMDCTSVSVVAVTPPQVDVSPSTDMLWPPNHKMVPVTIDVAVSGYGSEPVCQIVSVTSNEPEDGLGDGHHYPDWQITGDLTVDLRAERSGPGQGRIYTIVVECADASGRITAATAEVTVPHDRGKKKRR